MLIHEQENIFRPAIKSLEKDHSDEKWPGPKCISVEIRKSLSEILMVILENLKSLLNEETLH